MALKHLAPDTLFPSQQFAYNQVVVSEPGQQIFVAGQTSWNADQNIVGLCDLVAQAKQALLNIELALQSAGASRKDVTQMRVYIVNYSPDCLESLMPVFHEFWGDVPPPAQTMLGVESLALPEFLIEIDAVAVRS